MEATESIIMCQSKDGYNRGHYDVQINCFDTYLEMMVCPLCV